MRMNAYYYSFNLTGCEPIDKILSAVAFAGKGSHHTEDWFEYGYIGKIQQAADDAAKEYASKIS